MIRSFQPTKGFDIPPYHVESFYSGWSCVCNANGVNCLSVDGRPGVKFTSIDLATKIAESWNLKFVED